MISVAVIRASEIDLPLLVHVLGAMALLGLLATASVALLAARRADGPAEATHLTRFGLWTLVAGVLPAWVVMRIGAQWVYSRAGWEDAPEEPAWLGVGYVSGDGGGLLLAIAVALAVVALRRMRRAEEPPAFTSFAGGIAVLLVAVYVVAIWAMTAKPD